MLFKSKTPEKDPAMHHYTTPLAKKSNDLSRDGFTDQFVLVEGGLKSSETQKIYTPEDMKILKRYRFEGSSDPGSMDILYAVETVDGSKGTIVDGFGTYSDADLSEFMKNVVEEAHGNNPGANQSQEVEDRQKNDSV